MRSHFFARFSFGLLGLSVLMLSISARAQDRSSTLNTESMLSNRMTGLLLVDIAEYLKKNSSGFIQVKPKDLAQKSLTFRVNFFEKSLESTTVEDPDSLDQMFSFDEAAFIKSMNAPDFLQAKIEYYKKLAFDSKTQSYERKYLYPNDWKDLFFPPIHDLTLPNQQYDQRFVDRKTLSKESPYYSAEWHKGVDARTKTGLTFGNKLEILSNGISYDRKIELSKKATQSIYVGVMSVVCDKNSMELLNVLGQRVKEGVDVRIIMEGLWTDIAFNGCKKKLRDMGIEVILATDMMKLFKKPILFHNKIWIFDNQEVIMGGENIISADDGSTGFNHHNRDVDVDVKGPAVTDVMNAYADLYDHFVSTPKQKRTHRGVEGLRAAVAQRMQAETEAKARGQENYDSLLGSPDTRSKGVCRFGIQGPQGNPKLVSELYVEYISQAQQSLCLTSPDIDFQEGSVPDEELQGHTRMWNAVQERARKGVAVDVISNGIDAEMGEVGSKIRDLANKWQVHHPRLADFLRKLVVVKGRKKPAEDRHFLEVLAQNPSVRSWSFFQYYHGKTITMDRKSMAIGSFNLEHFSAEHSHESTIICQDDQMLKQQEKIILRDLVNSVPVFVEPDLKGSVRSVPSLPQTVHTVSDTQGAQNQTPDENLTLGNSDEL